MNPKLALAGLTGLALGTVLIAWYGFDAVGGALFAAGWMGLAAVTAFQVLPTAVCGLAWWALVRESPSKDYAVFCWARWIRDGVGNVLALVPASGEIVGARVLALRGLRAEIAGASVIVDLTAELLSQVLFTLLGLVLMLLDKPDKSILYWGAVGLALGTPAALGFLLAQRAGVFKLVIRWGQRISADWRRFEAERGASLHQSIEAMYRRPRRFLAGVLLHLGGWILSAAGTWLALWFLNCPVSFPRALVLESLVFALRTAAFFVPWGTGIQEAGYMVVGAVFGLPPDAALALSLLKRARDLVLGIPAAATWHIIEGRRLLRRAKVGLDINGR